MKNTHVASDELSQIIVKGMLEKKAHDIAIVDLRHIKNAIADFFIICSGNSDTQVDAISEAIEQEVYKHTHQHALHKEGRQNREWILLDYADAIAHVFKKEKRDFYALEDLWGDAEITYIEE